MNDLGARRDYHKDPSVPEECQQQFGSGKCHYIKRKSVQMETPVARRTHFATIAVILLLVIIWMETLTTDTMVDTSYATNIVPKSTGLNQS